MGAIQNVFYVGALGSKKPCLTLSKTDEDGMFTEEVGRICGPIGLDIGSKTPAEIAIAILAEIISFQRKL